MQKRSRKIWKQKYRAQSPTAMFWSLGCRPTAWATPVMPMRSPGDKLRPEPHPCQPVIWSMAHVPAHAAPHWVLTSPGAGGPLTGCLPKLKRLIHLSKVTQLTAKSQDSNPSPSDSRAQALNPSHARDFPTPIPIPWDLSPKCFEALGKAERGAGYFFNKC